MDVRLDKIWRLLHTVYKEEEYPALARQIEDNKKTKPLNGVRVLDATPVFRNTLLKYISLLTAGADLTIGISDVMAHDSRIVAFLREIGIPVVHAKDQPKEQDMILDCAGSFSLWPSLKGISELTRSGVEIYSHASLPVFLADGGRIKRIETCLGTGESYFRAMKQMGYDDWKGKKIVVFGSGKVGTGIIYYAHQLGAEVYVVTDLQTLSSSIQVKVKSTVHYTDSEAIELILKKAYAVVTATGVKNALSSYCPTDALLQSGALLANMGVEDEYGPEVPSIAVLEGKRTLNFILEEPTLLKYIDATMALHNEGVIYLLTHPKKRGLIIPPSELEEKILTTTRESGCIRDELNWI